MGQLVEEVQQWNSPSVGAYLLWKFTMGYCNAHPNGDAPIGLLHFIAVPILTSMNLIEPISNKLADLQSYIRRFENKKDSDVLLGIHEMIKEKREYTMASIDIAIATGLIVWDVESGKIYPRKPTNHTLRGNSPKAFFVKNGNKAEILGRWFAEHNLSTISSYLKVIL